MDPFRKKPSDQNIHSVQVIEHYTLNQSEARIADIDQSEAQVQVIEHYTQKGSRLHKLHILVF